MSRTRLSSQGYEEASYKASDGHIVRVPFEDLDANTVASGRPWRVFPWYLGQRNYAGLYWSATEQKLVGYESRLERARLMMLDFAPEVKRIVSQPFRLRLATGDMKLSRVPDYLACTEGRPLIIDVKPHRQLLKPEVREVLDLTRQSIESRGWRYEICSEPGDVEFSNVRFLAGYRRDALFSQERLDVVRSIVSNGDAPTIGQIVRDGPLPRHLILPALFHLLWRQEFAVDLSRKISSASAIGRTT